MAFFCTHPAAAATDILVAVADRHALETTFRDCKEIVEAGQQQVPFIWANIGAFHVCLWTFRMTETWAWKRPEVELLGHRSASPWVTNRDGRATRTSGGRGGGNCWETKSGPLSAPA